jgi:hypothetical protein
MQTEGKPLPAMPGAQNMQSLLAGVSSSHSLCQQFSLSVSAVLTLWVHSITG